MKKAREPASASSCHRLGATMSKAKTTLLLVDDDTAHRTMLKAHLGGQGYELVEAEDGDIAVHLVKERTIDLVLLDLNLPDGSGLDLLPDIRALKYPVAIFSEKELV